MSHMTQRPQVIVLGKSGVAVSHTGNTSETTLATVTIPANAMGLNGVLRISSVWRAGANNGNAKTPRIRLNGIAGTTYFTTALASSLSARDMSRTIANRGAANSQIGGASGSAVGASTTAVTTSAIDTTAAVDLVFTGQLADGSDTIALDSYLVELVL